MTTYPAHTPHGMGRWPWILDLRITGGWVLITAAAIK